MKVQSPSRLFSEGLQAILVGVVWYHMIQSRHITGNPLNFFPLCLFTHLPVTVPTLSHIWVLQDLMLLIPLPIGAYMHLSSKSFCACFVIASLTPSERTSNSSNCFWVSLLCTLKFSSASTKQSSSMDSWCSVDIIFRGRYSYYSGFGNKCPNLL